MIILRKCNKYLAAYSKEMESYQLLEKEVSNNQKETDTREYRQTV